MHIESVYISQAIFNVSISYKHQNPPFDLVSDSEDRTGKKHSIDTATNIVKSRCPIKGTSALSAKKVSCRSLSSRRVAGGACRKQDTKSGHTFSNIVLQPTPHVMLVTLPGKDVPTPASNPTLGKLHKMQEMRKHPEQVAASPMRKIAMMRRIVGKSQEMLLPLWDLKEGLEEARQKVLSTGPQCL